MRQLMSHIVMPFKWGGVMKTAVEQLSTYKSLHLNKKNLATHVIGIPLIIFAVLIWLSQVSYSFSFDESGASGKGVSISLGMLFVLGISLYYLKLHIRLALGMILFTVPLLYLGHLISLSSNAFLIGAAVFLVGWVFQFVGHAYEKAKPAFVDDLNQLLIGPFFLMAELYFWMGQEKNLEDEITPIAIQKRKAYEIAKKNSN